MKLARVISRFEDLSEDVELLLDLTDADVAVSLLCPMKEEEAALATVTMINAEIGKLNILIKQETFAQFDFEDVYAIMHIYKNGRTFSPLSMWINVRRVP